MARVAYVALLAVLIGLSAPGVSASKAKITPVQKVIQMMNDMLAKGIKEKEDEVVTFATYKQFCDSTRAEKKKAIQEATENIEQLTADIAKYTADAEALAKEVAGHEEEIATWSSEKAKTDEERSKEHEDFMTTDKDYASSIDSVDRAIKTLAAQPTSVGQAASLVQVEAVLRHAIPEKAQKAIMSFLQQSDRLRGEAFLQAPQANAFESSTGGVQEMIKGLGDKFEDEKDELEKQEMEKDHAYQMMVSDLVDQIENAQNSKDEKAASKAEKETAAGEAKGDLADNKNALAADSKFLKDLETECEAKAGDYEKRQVLRAGEITALKKAIEIMSSDKVGGGTQHLPGLVQTSLAQIANKVTSASGLSTTEQSVLQGRVAQFLQGRAQSSGSRVLALVAAKAGGDPFGKVTKMIRDMITKLMEEAQEEAEHKGFCDTEMKTNELTRTMKTEETDKGKAEAELLTADISKLTEEIQDISADIAAIDASMQKATAERQAEKAKNTATISDAKIAGEATQQALTVLKDFYEGASTATALTQTTDEDDTSGGINWDPNLKAMLHHGADQEAALNQMDASVPGAPETFDKPYKGMGGESGGVVGMLEVISSDFARLETETTEAEASAADIYKRFSNDCTKDKKVKSVDLKHRETGKADSTAKLQSVKKDLATSQEELDAALAYFEKLKPSCVDAGVSYEDRVARRKEEIESLKEALKILNGE